MLELCERIESATVIYKLQTSLPLRSIDNGCNQSIFGIGYTCNASLESL